jgi:hypothetical protein
MSAPSALSELADKYNVWPEILFLLALSIIHFGVLLVCYGFRSLGEVSESYYAFRTRCDEARHRYEQQSQ